MKKFFILPIIFLLFMIFISCSDDAKSKKDDSATGSEQNDADTTQEDGTDNGTETGDNGDSGDTGTGDTGDTGDNGDTGSGDTGDNGDSGDTGSGDTGDNGGDETGDDDSSEVDEKPETDIVDSCGDGFFKLTFVIDPVGSGDAWGTPAGIDNTNCYAADSQVKLVAEAAEGWVFGGWKGEAAEEIEASGGETVTMNGDKEIRALFKPMEEVECDEGMIKLTVKVQHQEDGNIIYDEAGTVTKSPAGTATSDNAISCYQPGTVVTIEVTENQGFSFDKWKGKNKDLVSGTFLTFQITADFVGEEQASEMTLRANFLKN